MWRRLLLGAITACCRNQARSCPMSRRRRRAHCRRYSRRRSCQLSTAAMQHQHRRTLQSLARERPDYCDGACNEPTCASNRLRANDHAIRTNMNAIAGNHRPITSRNRERRRCRHWRRRCAISYRRHCLIGDYSVTLLGAAAAAAASRATATGNMFSATAAANAELPPSPALLRTQDKPKMPSSGTTQHTSV
jgi:hypothetical protein